MNDITHYPDVLVKYAAESDVALIHVHNIDVKANHVYLFSDERYAEGEGYEPGVEFAMANTFVRNLNLLMRKSSEPILVHMKLCGGFVDQGLAIYDLLKACPNRVTVLAYTDASSMSSIILQGADRRVMMPHAKYMLHGGGAVLDGTTKQVLTGAEELLKSDQDMIDIYVQAMKRTGCYRNRSKKFIAGWLRERMDAKEEVYLDAKEAVKYGLADEVFGDYGYDWLGLLRF